jgi:hypothetical protein
MKLRGPAGVQATPMRSLPARVFSVALVMGVAFAAFPAAAKSYTDIKQRFSLTLPSQWKLHPVPGDTRGMRFKKGSGGTFGIVQVMVRPLEGSETPEQSLEAYTAPYQEEIGFQLGADVPGAVGFLPALTRTFTVYASGDKRTVRAIQVYVLHAFGHVHLIHYETLKQHTKRFARDVDRMLASYKATAGRKIYGPLVARWDNQAEGPALNLDETGEFSLGPLKGRYLADGGRLTLFVKGGKEWYRYILKGNQLTLKSPNLDEPSRYKRTGAARFSVIDKEKKRFKPLTRRELIGKWKALDTPGTEPLVLQLASTGSVAFGGLSGSWWYKRGLLTIRSTAGRTITYTVSKAKGGKQLVMGGGDLDEDMRLERMQSN